MTLRSRRTPATWGAPPGAPGPTSAAALASCIATVTCDLSASTTTEASATLLVTPGAALSEDSPWLATFYGSAEDGADLCCHLAPHAFPLTEVVLLGTDLDDTLACDTTAGDEGLLSDVACSVTSYGGDDVIDGGDGPDVLDSGPDSDTVRGHDGDDVITTGSGPDLINPGPGEDLVESGGGADVIRSYADADVDVLHGEDHVDTLCTLGANDALHSDGHGGGTHLETLFISAAATGTLSFASTSNTATECGHDDWSGAGAWAGSDCLTYTLSSPPAQCPDNF